MHKWYQDDNGNISSIRIITVPATYVGFFVILSGVVAMFLSLKDAGIAMTTGAGMIATAQGAKAWQKRHEHGRSV